jgi:ABC-type branched-subunit amino acid transport system permease subunit
MTTVNGLPSHVLFVHFIVVLAPLTALLAILCAVWPAARRRLVWLVLGLAVVNAALTPLTTHAGEWLENRVGRSPRLHTHTELGDTMLYFSIALLVAAILLALLHVRTSRSGSVNTVAAVAIAVVVVVASVTTTVQVYRIGDSGAQAAWGDTAAATTP